MNIPIALIDKRMLKFDDLQKDPALDTATGITISLGHDLEMTNTDEWLVHVDVWLTVPGRARALTRTDFALSTPFKNIWQEGVAKEFVKPALSTCRQAINDNCKEHGIECEIGESFPAPEHVESCFGQLMRDVAACNLYAGEDKNMYIPGYFQITPGKETNLVYTVTVIVLDEIFMDNPNFNRPRNLENFLTSIPLRNYNTIKIKMMELHEGNEVELNMRQLAIYIFMIRCACTLLLSDHYDAMKEGLENKGVTEELCTSYIKAANTFLNSLKMDLAKSGTHITNLEEDIDWVAMVS